MGEITNPSQKPMGLMAEKALCSSSSKGQLQRQTLVLTTGPGTGGRAWFSVTGDVKGPLLVVPFNMNTPALECLGSFFLGLFWII